MNTIVLFVVSGMLLLLPSIAHGANSLEELRNQVVTEIKYRAELIRYTTEHGMQNKYGSPFDEKDTIELESVVKEHIAQCMYKMTPSTGHC